MKKILKVGLPVFVILVIILQFFGPKAENPSEDQKVTLFQVSVTPPDVQKVLKESCYDCHSNTTVYPWYASVAPVSWLVINHINDGRKHLNFSEWGSYPLKKQIHKLEETIEMVNNGEMPLSSYVLLHGGAELDQTEKDLLLNWSKQTMADLQSQQTNTGNQVPETGKTGEVREKDEHGEDAHGEGDGKKKSK